MPASRVTRLAVTYICALLLVAISFPLPAAAQEARWKELDAQSRELAKQGKYAEAIPVAQEAVKVAESTFGPDNNYIATSLNILAEMYRRLGKYSEAEPLYKRALAIKEKNLGPEHADVAALLNNLALVYDDQGNYDEAEPLYQRALEIKQKTLGPDDPALASSLNNLALVYQHQGRYRQAEPLYQRALTLYEKALGRDHPRVASAANNLGSLYDDEGRYDEAEQLYGRALQIREKVLPQDHPDTATSLNNLGKLYLELRKYDEAQPLLKRALEIKEKDFGPDNIALSSTLNNLAAVYEEQGRLNEAESLYRRALDIREKGLGPEDPSVASALNNLAVLYDKQRRYAEAEPLYQRALKVCEKAPTPNLARESLALSNLGDLYYKENQPRQAASYYDRSLALMAREFDYYFTFMSEKNRLEFLSTVSGRFPMFFNFCSKYRQQFPDLSGKMYDLALWERGLVAQSMAAVRAQIGLAGDKEGILLADQLAAKRARLVRLGNAMPPDQEQWRKQVDQLSQEANDLESELVRHSAIFAEQKKLSQISWRDLQKALKPDEAAVEFVRFPYFDGKKEMETFCYVALVVRPKSAQPAFIVLADGTNTESLETNALRNYRQNIRQQQTTAVSTAPSFYEVFWKPLEPALAGAKRIYLSPDGVLNQISLAVVPHPNGKLLIERYDLRIVNSTKDILRQKQTFSSNSGVLIGNPAYNLDEAAQRSAVSSLQNTAIPDAGHIATVSVVQTSITREHLGGALAALPATQVEVEEIASVLEKQKWQVQLYTGTQALKESIVRVQHPRVLHVATHGFFQPDAQYTFNDRPNEDLPAMLEDPMLRSGLFFAGANRTLSGQPSPDDLEDGVLTAYEATGLNLQSTELVVLSACDTGRGEQQTGEGVFGLRRAFQEAGAQSLLMSMWSVPDQETQELMTLFYSKWLTGKDKHEALREAQLELREKVKARYGKDSPFYWGGFVLVGP
jgi:CHAT domain-containing protein/Tfp pilus assembly protein PilF